MKGQAQPYQPLTSENAALVLVDPTFRTSDRPFRDGASGVLKGLQGRPEGVLRDAKQGEDLALEVRQLDVEDLHGLAVGEEHMALDEAEEPEHLFGRRTLAAPLLRVQRQLRDVSALHRET